MFTTLTNRITRTLAAAALPIALLGAAGAAQAADRGHGDRDRRDDHWRDHDRGRSDRDRGGWDRDRGGWDHDRDGFHAGITFRIGAPVIVRPRVVVERPRVVVCEPPPVICSTPPVVISRPIPVCEDTAPCEISFSAYQCRDTVIVAINGANNRAGFSTTVTCADASCWTPTLTLRNVGPRDCSCDVRSSFSLTTSLRVTRCVSSVNVVVAGRTYSVPVTEASPVG